MTECEPVRSITAVRSMPSPATERLERLLRSSTRASVHRSSARANHIGRPHPSGIPFSRSTPVPFAMISVARTGPTPGQQGVSGPRIAAPDDPGFAPMLFGSANSNRLRGSAPTPRALATSGRGVEPGPALLRKTPADNLVKSGRATTPCEAHQDSHRRPQRIHRRFPQREP